METPAMFRLEELGTSKSAVRRCFEKFYDRPADDEWANRVRALLYGRRASFTLYELETLIDVFDTSHHQCVLENRDDFSPLVVSLHVRLEDRLDRWRDLIHQRQLADAPKSAA